jgi:hypothetical protein
MLLIAAATVYKLFAPDASFYAMAALVLAILGSVIVVIGIRRFVIVRRDLNRIA